MRLKPTGGIIMKRNLKILFQGDDGGRLEILAKKMGSVARFSLCAPIDEYDLIALDGKLWNDKEMSVFVNKALNKGKSVSITCLKDSQVNIIYGITGIKPPYKAQGALLGKHRDTGGHLHYLCKFIPEYTSSFKKALEQKNISIDDIIDSFMYKGVMSHVSTLKKPIFHGIPPENNLVPPYSQSPFGIYTFREKTYRVPVSGMKNLDALNITARTDFYCYHENGGGRNNYWVAGITSLSDISPASPIYIEDMKSYHCGNSAAYRPASFHHGKICVFL
jgi:hypothetical protein